MEGGIDTGRHLFQYPIIRTVAPFDRVVLAPNGTIGTCGLIEFAVCTLPGGAVPLVEWAAPEVRLDEGRGFPTVVNVDVLQLDDPMRELTSVSRRPAGDETTRIRRLGVTIYNSRQERPSPDGLSPVRQSRRSSRILPVEFISQFAAEADDRDSLCCPTSATMLLRYWGVDIDVREFARLSYDRRHQLYGNWSLTVAAMSAFGLCAWVQRHYSLIELSNCIDAGRPVIVSVAFDAGKLPGSPIKKTAGHLLVVRGFAEDGTVLVNDPAGHDGDAGQIAYDYSAFSRAWLGHGGIALHAVPEELVR